MGNHSGDPFTESPTETPKQKNPFKRLIINSLGIIIVLIVGIAIGSAAAGTSTVTKTVTKTQTVPGPTVTVTVTPPPPPAASGTVMNGDGVYVVGTDIKHGVWHTKGALTDNIDPNCYYALLSSTNTNDIIDNNNVTGPATITVGPNVKAVQVGGCQTWHRIG